ncbi:oligopeptide/dipeptide ABC transporter ATP-binding protein [Amycolatopsis sp. cmx-8-4]|uniref:oligopeptide/dipeptide ABC transporter ATP-binding protein n=1 Tax=Amycolatopsis sp. cmx-8-4 TaxID=2790947 RepID=UPI00397C691F
MRGHPTSYVPGLCDIRDFAPGRGLRHPEPPEAARHPYTRALFSATPSLLHQVEPIVLTGPVPSATHPPSGCPFRTRCPKATGECAAEPPLAAADGGHTYRCIHPETPAGVSA